MSDAQSTMMLRPPIKRTMRTLDRAFFKTTVPISAARVHKIQDISEVRSKILKSKDKFVWNRIPSLKPDPDEKHAKAGGKCLLLKPEVKHDDRSTWSPTIKDLENEGTIAVIPYTLDLDYDSWTYDDIMRAILPEEDMHGDIPTGFSTIGHVAHMNLRERYLPYKHTIAQIIKDKSSSIKTVINKIDPIGNEENEFRTFQYEVLVGEDDLDVEARHQDCIFRFNFGKVYWNPRLHTEHQRIIKQFQPGQAICDVMAGIGPFAIPAAKWGRHFVFANDLNPESYRYLKDAIELNGVEPFVEPFNEDGHDFIRTSAQALALKHKRVVIKGKKPRHARQPAPETYFDRPATFAHYTMNLPGNAIDFISDFIGLYNKPFASKPQAHDDRDLPRDPRQLFEPYTAVKLPMVHVYCFCSEDDNEAAKRSICKRISEKLEYEITPDTPEVHIEDVRKVSTHKRYFCASFRLPHEVVFRNLEV
ncbi:guanine methyltransferase Trm5 [Pseudovirgaria hyperparasitica]|uniref:tRNA (guanine(37)-N1)-methyltransferase n=1 Tax=Pseudovirgaria hyperparasitica TaxID=470096 RepID=A0A6A6W6F1_9PEZI|nr:guanine methyltransferase Trm5 [Pseudovirgaria hyperparasitica]KAF2756651.1 guanine methyltransferase Trm5 [Pseudovirgaria hyperparasitica]